MVDNSIPTEFMVRVECMTFNHAPYIEDAMNGFCMQQTDFPFVCVIVDDASTDGEQIVIQNYLEQHFDLDNSLYARKEETDDYQLSFAQHKTNHNCFFGILLLKYNHYGKKDKRPYFEKWSNAKYIALCEGDDYWIHPKKLNMQVEALELYPECSFCGTGFKIISREGTDKDMTLHTDNEHIHIYDIEAWGKLWINKTLTLMIRNEILSNYESVKVKYKKPKDAYLSYHMFKNGKCAYIPKCLGVYNDMGQGIWNSLPYYEKIKWDTYTMQELYFKNGKDVILYNRYISMLVSNILCSDLNEGKISLLIEGIRESKNYYDKRKIVDAYVSYLKHKYSLVFISYKHKQKSFLHMVKRMIFNEN